MMWIVQPESRFPAGVPSWMVLDVGSLEEASTGKSQDLKRDVLQVSGGTSNPSVPQTILNAYAYV